MKIVKFLFVISIIFSQSIPQTADLTKSDEQLQERSEFFETAKIKSKQALKWVKDHKKSTVLLAASLFTCALGFSFGIYKQNKTHWQSFIHSPVYGLAAYSAIIHRYLYLKNKHWKMDYEDKIDHVHGVIMNKLRLIDKFFDKIANTRD
ncbi:hypothetical protein M1446_03605 [Candidatus Dependentiae bacterium]|nr:hypothetical protein [Candidatus Dependentiae bacterium]